MFQLGRRSSRMFDHFLGCIICYVPVTVARMHVAHVLCTAPGAFRRQDTFECLPEFRVEYRVDDRIERGIRVAQPRQDFERLAANARFAEGGHNVDAEKRHPTDEEYAHDDANGNGRLMVGHMVRRRVVQLSNFKLFLGTWPSYAAISILFLFGNFAGSSYGPYRFDVLLSVAIESVRKGRSRKKLFAFLK